MTGPVMVNGQPNPTGTGPYCAPRACYCGQCPSWRPIPQPDYSRLAAAANKAAEKQRRSWATPAEATWTGNQ